MSQSAHPESQGGVFTALARHQLRFLGAITISALGGIVAYFATKYGVLRKPRQSSPTDDVPKTTNTLEMSEVPTTPDDSVTMDTVSVILQMAPDIENQATRFGDVAASTGVELTSEAKTTNALVPSNSNSSSKASGTRRDSQTEPGLFLGLPELPSWVPGAWSPRETQADGSRQPGLAHAHQTGVSIESKASEVSTTTIPGLSIGSSKLEVSVQVQVQLSWSDSTNNTRSTKRILDGIGLDDVIRLLQAAGNHSQVQVQPGSKPYSTCITVDNLLCNPPTTPSSVVSPLVGCVDSPPCHLKDVRSRSSSDTPCLTTTATTTTTTTVSNGTPISKSKSTQMLNSSTAPGMRSNIRTSRPQLQFPFTGLFSNPVWQSWDTPTPSDGEVLNDE